ncbi:Ni/Fe-hydrogenase, b-type cytochrome subunit [Limisalsivibrio acetivorans]|uniref:Ni/Fe-hydrogenase, b-type cytochrome subunit n=1 Tax=Limisalsivibrio acetivorans TaxID=1304888 RepID=UPI0003B7308E|nr:Ni/Fe-hydrogenase, b-type cytochrome subunit [Limisalsivibrio acetivorans]
MAALSPELRKLCPAKGFVYVWEAPVRISHWVSVVCIMILAVTGLYIHYPFFTYDTVNSTPYVMGQVRYIHYLTGFIFTTSVLLRLWWAIVGNQYAHIRTVYNPFKKKDRKLIISYLKYYFFLEKNPPHTLTHNPMAQYAYIGIFLVFIFQIFSGFYLWSLNDPHSTLYASLTWFNSIGNVQYIRMLHYFVVYIIATFLIIHLYAAVLVDFRTHSGDVSSIFSGWKADT